MKNVLFYLVLLSSIVLFSCDKNRVFEEYKTIDENGWQKDSPVIFDFPVSDTLQYHNLYINVRNKLDYKYSNLWLFIYIKQPGGVAVKDTFEIVLADPAGKWTGEGFGGLKEKQIRYRQNVFFPVSGEYEISIQQGMRTDTLTGLKDIGFRVEKVQ